MPTPPLEVTDLASPGLLGPDPGLPIRRWVAGLLRAGIGLSLVNSGLAGYLGVAAANGPMGLNAPGGIDPFFGSIPYIEIGLGMAVLLGFLLTPSAIAAGSFAMIGPVLMTVQMATTGTTTPGLGFRNNPNLAALMMYGVGGGSLLSALLPHAALIWLSPLENHPYSVDALVFNRGVPEPFHIPATPDAPAEPPAAGPEG